MSEHRSGVIHTGEVVLDIGEGMGGLIVYTTPDLRDDEVEVFPVSDPNTKTHTDVQQRLFNNQTIYTAVFTPLHVGTYQVARPRDRSTDRFEIRSGVVTELDWR